MNDLTKKLASRRERLDQQGDYQSNNNSSSNLLNGTSNDKIPEYLKEFLRKEISQMKLEIIETIKTELRQR